MNQLPILSILIPTKNREQYALNIVQHILAIPNKNFQLVIQDNSDSNNLEALLATYLNDSRLNYFYHAEILSFVDNFSLGISKCIGEYVTIIGDDDGINPLIIDFAKWASENNIEAITPSLPIIYFWPQSGVSFAKDNGMLTISGTSCKASLIDPKSEIKRFLRNGCHNYLDYNLAKAYHGVVKRTVLEKIKLQTGNFIGGLSPDIYLSMAISILVDKVLIIDYPLTISGICKKSGSSDSSTGRHTGELRNAPHFKGHTNYKWSDKVPAFYSVETIWGDSALAAIHDLNATLIGLDYREFVLSIYCSKLYPEFKSIIVSNLEKNNAIFKNHFFLLVIFFIGSMLISLNDFKKFILKKFIFRKSYKVFNDVDNMVSASEICNKFIKMDTKLVFVQLNKFKFD